MAQALESWLRYPEPLGPMIVENPIRDGQLSIAPLRLGTQVDTGVLVVGSQRADFPTITEMLLLRIVRILLEVQPGARAGACRAEARRLSLR